MNHGSPLARGYLATLVACAVPAVAAASPVAPGGAVETAECQGTAAHLHRNEEPA